MRPADALLAVQVLSPARYLERGSAAIVQLRRAAAVEALLAPGRVDEEEAGGCGQASPPPACGGQIQGEQTMSTITTQDGTQIYYKDWGSGQLIVFSHGWPLTSDS